MYWKTALCILGCVLLCTSSSMADPGGVKVLKAKSSAMVLTAAVSTGNETGACCFNDGTCEILTQGECAGGPGAQGGIWLGPDSTCDMCESQPVEDGACCFDDGTCEITDEFTCWDAWGIWLGPDTTCDMCEAQPVEDGACCFDDGTCEITAPEDCLDGFWLGPDTTCDMCETQPVEEGACCFNDGTCEILTQDECFGSPGTQGGFWLGPDTTCDMCESQLVEPRFSDLKTTKITKTTLKKR